MDFLIVCKKISRKCAVKIHRERERKFCENGIELHWPDAQWAILVWFQLCKSIDDLKNEFHLKHHPPPFSSLHPQILILNWKTTHMAMVCMCICSSKNFFSMLSERERENALTGNWMKNIRIIFSDTIEIVGMGINYTASILFPFVGLIFGKNSTKLVSLVLYLSGFSLYCSHSLSLSVSLFGNPIFISATNRANQRFVEMHLNEFECGSIAVLSRHITRVHVSLVCICVFVCTKMVVYCSLSFGRRNASRLIYSMFAFHFILKYCRLENITSIERLSKIWFPFPGIFLTPNTISTLSSGFVNRTVDDCHFPNEKAHFSLFHMFTHIRQMKSSLVCCLKFAILGLLEKRVCIFWLEVDGRFVCFGLVCKQTAISMRCIFFSFISASTLCVCRVLL